MGILSGYSVVIVAAETVAVDDVAGVEGKPGPVAAFQASSASVAVLVVEVDTD